MDFSDKLMDFVEAELELFSNFVVGKLSQEENSIAFRQIPSSPSGRYLDKSKNFEFSFQVLVKNQNQLKAIATANEIVSLLDGLENSDIESSNNSFKLISCKVYTLPHYVETLEHGESIYTALFTAEIEGGY